MLFVVLDDVPLGTLAVSKGFVAQVYANVVVVLNYEVIPLNQTQTLPIITMILYVIMA